MRWWNDAGTRTQVGQRESYGPCHAVLVLLGLAACSSIVARGLLGLIQLVEEGVGDLERREAEGEA